MADPSISEDNSTVYYVAVLIITLVAIWVLQKTLLSGGKALGIIKGDTLLILGPSNSGKTALYYKLATGKVPETMTSMKELDTELKIKGAGGEEDKAVKVVDFPGHPRLRGNLPKFLNRAKSIVFVVDSTTVSRDVTPICEYLFTVMTSSIAAQNLPVLIACNKSDKEAPGIAKVKSTLEKELSNLIDTAGSLGDTGGGDDGSVTLKKSGESFSFDTDAPCKISFISCSATKTDCSEVVDFMRSAM